ncbi:hypothetical protein ACHAJE_005398, partial [Klebsiella pneumoniae]
GLRVPPHPLYVVSAASEKTTTCSYQRHNGAGTSAVRKKLGFYRIRQKIASYNVRFWHTAAVKM